MDDITDLFGQGIPERVRLSDGDSLIGLSIRGLEKNVMLGIKEDVFGRPVSCVVTDALPTDHLIHHSNPRRSLERDDP